MEYSTRLREERVHDIAAWLCMRTVIMHYLENSQNRSLHKHFRCSEAFRRNSRSESDLHLRITKDVKRYISMLWKVGKKYNFQKKKKITSRKQVQLGIISEKKCCASDHNLSFTTQNKAIKALCPERSWKGLKWAENGAKGSREELKGAERSREELKRLRGAKRRRSELKDAERRREELKEAGRNWKELRGAEKELRWSKRKREELKDAKMI